MPDQSTEDLHIHIDVHIGDERQWEHDHHVPVPPAYTEQDIEPFVLHELDRAVHAHQTKHHGRSRMVDIIHQYELRSLAIENLIAHAPRSQSRAGLAALILAVVHADAEDLLKYEHTRLED
jgi:hypothetical protein